MKIAYLTNQYPHVRHTFIRREIVALEAHGVTVVRLSIRDSGHDAVDPADIAEKPRTRTLLVGKCGLLLDTLRILFTRPVRLLKAVRRTIRFGRRSERGVLRHLIYLAEACRLVRWLQAEKVEYLHVHFATNPAVVALLCRDLGGPPYGITIHGPEEWDQPAALSLPEKYAEAAVIVAVSDFGRCQVYRWSDRTHWGKVRVVRCGVDEGFLGRQPEAVPDVSALVLVAGLVEQKGHLMLVQALELVKNAGHAFHMIFVGDGHLRPVLEAELISRGLSQHITLVGWQSNAAVREYLRTSRALVMPSFAENLPVAMMEALATGRPVLGTYIAGVPELVEAGVTGWMVPAGNVSAIARAIVSILTTPVERLTELGRNGAERVRTMHDARVEAGKLVPLFRAVIAGQPLPTEPTVL